jgi:hypothetical protein
MRAAFGLLFLLAFSCHLQAQSLESTSRAILYGGLGYDLGTTAQFLKRGDREGNPLLGQHPARITAVSSGLTVFSDWVLTKTGKPKVASIVRIVLGSLHFSVGISNSRR